MNERIKQLLGQAYDEAVPETWTELSSIQLGRIYDKFAELIIRDCLTIMTDANHSKLRISDAIWNTKIHFGVEE